MLYIVFFTILLLQIVLYSSCSKEDDKKIPGAIEVIVTTSGVEMDANGFEILLDGGTSKQVTSNGSAIFDLVSIGSHIVSIGDVRINCDPVQGMSQNITVKTGERVTINFDIECTTKPLVFASYRSGDQFDVYRMNLDGSGVHMLAFSAFGPRWSQDGSQISFSNIDDNGLYIMNEDGSGKSLIVRDAKLASWSPDGLKLVFIKDSEIHTVNKDGTGLTKLTNLGAFLNDPDWGPASDPRIIFGYEKENDDSGIFIMNDDGSNLTRLTTGPDFQPSWSKDGTKIAFVRIRIGEIYSWIYTLVLNGGDPERRTPESGRESTPRWSPDGTQMTFTTLEDVTGGGYNYEVSIGSSTGPGATNLAQHDQMDLYSDWRPGN